jgi:hypothetical protein
MLAQVDRKFTTKITKRTQKAQNVLFVIFVVNLLMLFHLRSGEHKAAGDQNQQQSFDHQHARQR